MTTLLHTITKDNIEFRIGLHTVHMDTSRALSFIESHQNLANSISYLEKPLPPSTNSMLWTLRAGPAGILLLGQTLANRYVTGVKDWRTC